MGAICDTIRKTCEGNLESLISEENEENEGSGDLRREIWEVDMENRRRF